MCGLKVASVVLSVNSNGVQLGKYKKFGIIMLEFNILKNTIFTYYKSLVNINIEKLCHI